MAQITIEIQRLPHHLGLPLPEYKSFRSSGCDLQAALSPDEEVLVPPGQQAMVPTGIALAIPMGYEGQIRPRSGLALEHQIGVTNSPGTIDSDYTGELQVILRNFGTSVFRIVRGDRIAQLVIGPVVQAQWVEVSQLPITPRGEGGFGSTGRRGGEVRGLTHWENPPAA